MTDKEIQSELEALRAEVAALSRARREDREQQGGRRQADAAHQDPPASSAADLDEVAELEAASVDLEDSAAVQRQMDKLLAQLEHEIRDMPTVTTLAVFSLGVLFGRMLR